MTTSTPTSVPFSRLVATDAINARASTKDGLDELAASIAAKGLIQPLAVRRQDGTDKFEVIDGRRRFLAISKLVKAKTFAKTYPVAILVRDETDSEALETSLMANTVRLPMHAVDQYEAFARLAASGATTDEIAARFALSERTVRQQMALGKLHPDIRKAWKKGKIDADTAKAFACSNDPDRQLAAFKAAGSHITAYAVRRGLMGQRVAANGIPQTTLDLYVERGGTLTEDLFEDARYIDNQLMLAAVRKELAAGLLERVKAEGWGWVAMADDVPKEWDYDWDKLEAGGEPTPEEAAELDALKAKRQVSYGLPEFNAARARIQEINDAIIMRGWTMDIRATAGAVVTLRHDGEAVVDRGIIKPDGADTSALSAQADDDAGEPGDLPPVSAMTGAGGDDDADTSTGDDPFAISGALMETITTSQTNAAALVIKSEGGDLGLRIALACLKSTPWSRPAKISTTPYQGASTARGEFVNSLARMNETDLATLLEWLAAEVADALDLRAQHDTTQHDTRALVAALPAGPYLEAIRREFIAADYFKRATKAAALAAIDEIQEAGLGGAIAPEDVRADMKKADLAELAARMAGDHGWLPPQLRHPAYALPVSTQRTEAA